MNLQRRRRIRAAALSSRAYPTPFSHCARAFPHTDHQASPAAAVCRIETRVESQAVVPFARAAYPCRIVCLTFNQIISDKTITTNIPMTLIRVHCEVKPESMDKEDNGKTLRPVRNRRYTRRSLVAGQRPQKRLFTPEIKRYLKDWLVRRRDNPYPNREEKKHLAQETGLTYIQICNWFANWRRKLKNVNADRNQQTWGHLIRTYNDRAQGNVEQFSICSDDSIWSETEQTSPDREQLDTESGFPNDFETSKESQQDEIETSTNSIENVKSINNNSYDTKSGDDASFKESKNITSPLLLSKWLESAARFQPSESNYSWWADGKRRKPEPKGQRITLNTLTRHDRDEVEAAVALTALAAASTRLTAP